jgi:hypothetical protein
VEKRANLVKREKAVRKAKSVARGLVAKQVKRGSMDVWESEVTMVKKDVKEILVTKAQ